ncbi:MAG: nitroreductase family protein [Dehalococcoidia bacterium]
MDLYDVMRTTFSARQFTDAPLPDEVLARIFENARFAPSGGNRQGNYVIVVRDQATKDAIGECAIPGAKRYTAQAQRGENPWNSIVPPGPTAEEIAATEPSAGLTEPVRRAPAVLVVCVDLRVVASIDQDLRRVGIISGASIYPFTWNILLGLRNEGFGGTLTTMPIEQEPRLQEILGLPPYVAVAAIIPAGQPVKQLTKLRRKPVSDFARCERWDGEAFG